MNNLPIKANDNVFIKIKRFFINLFKKEKQVQYQQEEKEIFNEKNDFQGNIKATIIENEAIEKIDMQNRKISLLEKIARNKEILNHLSMEELIYLEKMYQEELDKMPNNA